MLRVQRVTKYEQWSSKSKRSNKKLDSFYNPKAMELILIQFKQENKFAVITLLD